MENSAMSEKKFRRVSLIVTVLFSLCRAVVRCFNCMFPSPTVLCRVVTFGKTVLRVTDVSYSC